MTRRRSQAGRASQARGKSWESVVEDALTLLQRSGVCAWWRTPETLKRTRPGPQPGSWICYPSGEGPPDYVVCHRGRGIALEAKQTTDPVKLSLGLIKKHQADQLDAWRRAGGASGILLHIAGRRLVVPWGTLGPMWRSWHNTPGRAAPGTASVSLSTLQAISHPMDMAGEWLTRLCEGANEERQQCLL